MRTHVLTRNHRAGSERLGSRPVCSGDRRRPDQDFPPVSSKHFDSWSPGSGPPVVPPGNIGRVSRDPGDFSHRRVGSIEPTPELLIVGASLPGLEEARADLQAFVDALPQAMAKQAQLELRFFEIAHSLLIARDVPHDLVDTQWGKGLAVVVDGHGLTGVEMVALEAERQDYALVFSLPAVASADRAAVDPVARQIYGSGSLLEWDNARSHDRRALGEAIAWRKLTRAGVTLWNGAVDLREPSAKGVDEPGTLDAALSIPFVRPLADLWAVRRGLSAYQELKSGEIRQPRPAEAFDWPNLSDAWIEHFLSPSGLELGELILIMGKARDGIEASRTWAERAFAVMDGQTRFRLPQEALSESLGADWVAEIAVLGESTAASATLTLSLSGKELADRLRSGSLSARDRSVLLERSRAALRGLIEVNEGLGTMAEQLNGGILLLDLGREEVEALRERSRTVFPGPRHPKALEPYRTSEELIQLLDAALGSALERARL